MANDRNVVIDKAIADITKKFGTGAVMKMGEKSHMDIEVIPSGSLLLDAALGVGGYPKGRIIEVYGPESSGKTTVTLHAIAEVQRQGGVAAFIDAEHALDPVYAKSIGVDIDNLLVSQPDTGEQALEITNELINTGAVDMVVIDSVAALVPRAEIEGEMGDSHVGLQARLMSQALRKLSGTINKQKTICIFINQLREKVGVIYGSPEVTPGGRALKFYSSIRLDVRKREPIKMGTDIVGSVTEIKVVKNKVAPPFKSVKLEMTFGKGFSKTAELLDLAVEMDIVDKAGAWYAYGGSKIGQGKENSKGFLESNPEIYEEIKTKVLAKRSGEELVEEVVKEAKKPTKIKEVIDENGEIITA